MALRGRATARLQRNRAVRLTGCERGFSSTKLRCCLQILCYLARCRTQALAKREQAEMTQTQTAAKFKSRSALKLRALAFARSLLPAHCSVSPGVWPAAPEHLITVQQAKCGLSSDPSSTLGSGQYARALRHDQR